MRFLASHRRACPPHVQVCGQQTNRRTSPTTIRWNVDADMVMRTIQDDDDDDNMHVIRNDVYEKRSG